MTEHELEGGMEAPLWVTPEEALALVEGAVAGLSADASTEAYNARFIARRDQLILQEYLRRLG